MLYGNYKSFDSRHFLCYWHVLLIAAILAQFRYKIGVTWIAVAFAVLSVFAVLSELFASTPEKDAVFFIGSFLRFSIASLFLLITASVGSGLRQLLSQRIALGSDSD